MAHASRVLTLGELAAAIAHELNQPLTAILGNAEAAQMLQERQKSADPEMDAALRDISGDAARGGEIIRKLRDLVRRRESKGDVLDVNRRYGASSPSSERERSRTRSCLSWTWLLTCPRPGGTPSRSSRWS